LNDLRCFVRDRAISRIIVYGSRHGLAGRLTRENVGKRA